MLYDATGLYLRTLTRDRPAGVAPLRREVALRNHVEKRARQAERRRRQMSDARRRAIIGRVAALAALVRSLFRRRAKSGQACAGIGGATSSCIGQE